MKRIILSLACLTFAFSAHALNLKEKKEYEGWKAALNAADGPVDSFKAKCGYAIPVTLDEKLVAPFMAENASGDGFCANALSVMAGLCEDAMTKKAISSQVKKLNCQLGKKGESSVALKGTELVFSFGVGASNLEDKVRDFLNNNLK
jgi:hypothetical protein